MRPWVDAVHVFASEEVARPLVSFIEHHLQIITDGFILWWINHRHDSSLLQMCRGATQIFVVEEEEEEEEELQKVIRREKQETQ